MKTKSWIRPQSPPRADADGRRPTPEEEDCRRLSRERKSLITERVRHVNRIKGLLFNQAVSDYQPLRRDRRQLLNELRTGNGREPPQHLKAQISRELDRLELLLERIRTVEAELRQTIAAAAGTTPIPTMLLSLKGIGEYFANVLWAEGLFRHFDNRRQSADAGLAPTLWQSGSIDREQGVSIKGW